MSIATRRTAAVPLRERLQQAELLREEVAVVESGQTVGRRLPLRGFQHAPVGDRQRDPVRRGER